MEQIYAIGLMSGTSMDGVDLVYCQFDKHEPWSFQILQADCIPYPQIWQSRLMNLSNQSAETFAKTNIYYGHFLGQVTREFMQKHQIQDIDFVSSHGQTIFHNPNKSYTIQIGHGAAIAKETGLKTICDLRTTDMAYGGQGAPIVPLGERDLFPEYKQFINIGGISNISIHHSDEIVGYDVCMGNIVMDELVSGIGLTMDENGDIARSGNIQPDLLEQLNNQSFFAKKPPKTLDADQVLRDTFSILSQFDIELKDVLATLVEHVAIQLSTNLSSISAAMLTGGGAFNSFMVERIQHHFANKIHLPDSQIIQYKEALIMAYLGLKRIRIEPNSLASVTGASKNTINGGVYLP